MYRIKTLEEIGWENETDRSICQTSMSRYRVRFSEERKSWFVDLDVERSSYHNKYNTIGRVATIEEAKAFAEQHYKSKIEQCLVKVEEMEE